MTRAFLRSLNLNETNNPPSSLTLPFNLPMSFPINTANQLRERTARELAQMARKKGISGWHRMRKSQLIKALVESAKSKVSDSRSSKYVDAKVKAARVEDAGEFLKKNRIGGASSIGLRVANKPRGQAPSQVDSNFDLKIDAHMVIRGTAHPDEIVMIADRVVQSESDGSFTITIDVPDRRQRIPITAENTDGTFRMILVDTDCNTKVLPSRYVNDLDLNRDEDSLPSDVSELNNKLRCELIDKKIQGIITEKESKTLDELQRKMEDFLVANGAFPIEGALGIHAKLLEKKRLSDSDL